MQRYLRLCIVIAAVGLVAAMVATPVSAGAPKFHSASSSVNNNGELVVSFDERGLGGDNVDYLLTADGTAVYACINGGGKNPSAANKRTNAGELAAFATLEVKNGRVVGTLRAGPISAGTFSCPSGQRLVLASVSYTNVLLTDLTNDVEIGVADASRTFLSV